MKQIVPPYWGKLQGQPNKSHVPSMLPKPKASTTGTGQYAPETGWQGHGRTQYTNGSEWKRDKT
jgi:hypothetical protein